MPSSSWDQCTLDGDILEQIDKICDYYGDQSVSVDLFGSEEIDLVGNDGGISPRNPARINSLQSSLHNTESVCRTSVETLDGILESLSGVGDAYAEVTGRTNNLMMNCERLLEQQHTLQQTVEILKSTIKPFTDIEEVACLLGIPFDGTTRTSNKAPSTTAVVLHNGGSHVTDMQHSANLDPRSPEFQDILARLAKSALFLQTHFDILDKQHYSVWLERLQLRATSLVGRAMRELIDKARNDCVDMHSKKLYSKGSKSNNLAITNGTGNKLQLTNGIDDTPIESAPLYQKFRGLSFRLRELGALLVRGGYFANIDGSTPHPTSQSNGSQTRRSGSHTSRNSNTPHSRRITTNGNDVVRPVIDEVRQGYVIVRSELLNTFMKDAWAAVLQANGAAFKHSGSGSNLSSASTEDFTSGLSPKSGSSSPTPSGASSGASLCMGIRQAFSTLLRVTQLEQQLFDSLFLVDSSDLKVHSASGDDFEASTPSSAMTVSSTPRQSHDTDSSEVMTIVETVSNATRDVLRPLIIRESSVDELCRVVSTLSEDVRSQMLAMPVPKLLLRQLLKGLDGTVHDAKERLSYCAETRIRQDVQMFEPIAAHLAYPEILETYAKAVSAAAASMSNTPGSALSLTINSDGDQDASQVAAAAAADVYTTWYPPMRFTLSLLSKLYGVVEMGVFEDFARRGVDLCVATLKTGSERVKRNKPHIHGDLFLVRHLLILREQLVPFEIRLQGTEKHLDFSSTGAAFTRFVANTQSVWRWDSANGLLLFAKSGIPGMQETQMDAKKDLDLVLRQACFSLKQSALKLLLGPLDAFLAKVTAFAGEIPTEPPSGSGGSGGANSGNFLAAGGSQVALLSTEARANIKNQAFVRPERIKDMLESAQSQLAESVPELRAIMRLYIENQVARTILIRPILQEFGVCQRKLESVVASCLDPGQVRRDLETLLQTIAYTVVAELSQ